MGESLADRAANVNSFTFCVAWGNNLKTQQFFEQYNVQSTV